MNLLGDKSVINILLLGETGVGKSTWINGISYYTTYTTLADAKSAVFEPAVPVKFVMTNADYNEIQVSVGSDENEKHADGQSSTQFAKSYFIRFGDIKICLVDTPGIGDTRGVEKDRENFENVLDHVKDFDKIHAICVLLKPNSSKLTAAFKYCLQEVLARLPEVVHGNIIFCFTHSRNTFYRPGDTMPALRKLLKDQASTKLRLVDETVYCIDNEAIRYLAARATGVKFETDEEQSFSGSWEKSVHETNRFLKYVTKLEPRLVRSMSLPAEKNTSHPAAVTLFNVSILGRSVAETIVHIHSQIRAIKQTIVDNQRSLEKMIVLAEEISKPVVVITSTATSERNHVPSLPMNANGSCNAGKTPPRVAANTSTSVEEAKLNEEFHNGCLSFCETNNVDYLRELKRAAKGLMENKRKKVDELASRLTDELKQIIRFGIKLSRTAEDNNHHENKDRLVEYFQHIFNASGKKDASACRDLQNIFKEYQVEVEHLHTEELRLPPTLTITEIRNLLANLLKLSILGTTLSRCFEKFGDPFENVPLQRDARGKTSLATEQSKLKPTVPRKPSVGAIHSQCTPKKASFERNFSTPK